MGHRCTRSSLSRWALGLGIIGGGAIVGAFGTVGWLTLLTVRSAIVAGVGILALGVVPVAVGLAMIWTGMNVVGGGTLEARSPTDAELVLAAADGATRDQIAVRLRLGDREETERRLDALVVREELDLHLTDGGELLYLPSEPATRVPTLRE